jgi:transcriptional regulator with XRE-family HTH domain
MKKAMFKEIIRKERKAQGLTQTELAQKAGVSRSCIAFIETGRREVSLGTADKILTVLGVGFTVGLELGGIESTRIGQKVHHE